MEIKRTIFGRTIEANGRNMGCEEVHNLLESNLRKFDGDVYVTVQVEPIVKTVIDPELVMEEPQPLVNEQLATMTTDRFDRKREELVSTLQTAFAGMTVVGAILFMALTTAGFVASILLGGIAALGLAALYLAIKAGTWQVAVLLPASVAISGEMTKVTNDTDLLILIGLLIVLKIGVMTWSWITIVRNES